MLHLLWQSHTFLLECYTFSFRYITEQLLVISSVFIYIDLVISRHLLSLSLSLLFSLFCSYRPSLCYYSLSLFLSLSLSLSLCLLSLTLSSLSLTLSLSISRSPIYSHF